MKLKYLGYIFSCIILFASFLVFADTAKAATVQCNCNNLCVSQPDKCPAYCIGPIKCTEGQYVDKSLVVTTSPEGLKTMAIGLNPAGFSSPYQVVGRFIKLAMQIIGLATLALFLYGGVLWMMSGGNSERRSKAVQVLVWTALGLVAITSSYLIINYIIEKLIK